MEIEMLDALCQGKISSLSFVVNGRPCEFTISKGLFRAKRYKDEYICCARGLDGSKIMELLKNSIIYRR